MRGTGDQKRWHLGLRWVAGIPVDRARLRLTATYALAPDLLVGVEYNPLADDVGVLANWRMVEEGPRRPALILGTSSDRIGTPSGRAYYATLSKDLEPWLGLPVAPYAGAAYGEFEDAWEAIGGLQVRWGEHWSSTHSWDGHDLHHLLDRTWAGGWRTGIVLVERSGRYYGGLSLGASL